MTVLKVDTDVRLPYDEEALLSKDPRRIADYMLQLVKTIRDLFEEISIQTNVTIDLVPGSAVYYGLKDENGDYPEGTWRRLQVGDNLEDQVLLSGVWTQVQVRERPQ